MFYHGLGRKVDRIEQALGSVLSRIDMLQVKLDSVESAKNKRRETMTQLLDDICEDAPDVKPRKKSIKPRGSAAEFGDTSSTAFLRPDTEQSKPRSLLSMKVYILT